MNLNLAVLLLVASIGIQYGVYWNIGYIFLSKPTVSEKKKTSIISLEYDESVWTNRVFNRHLSVEFNSDTRYLIRNIEKKSRRFASNDRRTFVAGTFEMTSHGPFLQKRSGNRKIEKSFRFPDHRKSIEKSCFFFSPYLVYRPAVRRFATVFPDWDVKLLILTYRGKRTVLNGFIYRTLPVKSSGIRGHDGLSGPTGEISICRPVVPHSPPPLFFFNRQYTHLPETP